MGKIAIFIGILVAACSGESSSGASSSGGPTQPTSCDPSLRMGTFLEHFVELAGGNCGPVPDTIARIDTGSVAAGCEFGRDDWSDGECKLSRVFRCPVGTVGDFADYTAVSTDTRGDGSYFTGILSMQVYDSRGLLVCESTYDVVFTRQ